MANIRQTSHSSIGGNEKTRIEGSYSGLYRREGSDTLIRISDGLTLVIGQRGGFTSPRSSNLYLVDKTIKQGYLSNLYGQEFDDTVYRYRITATGEPQTFQIDVLRTVKKGQNFGGQIANV